MKKEGVLELEDILIDIIKSFNNKGGENYNKEYNFRNLWDNTKKRLIFVSLESEKQNCGKEIMAKISSNLINYIILDSRSKANPKLDKHKKIDA